MERLVYAEIDSVTEEMRNDPKVLIISDGALFMVTTKTNSKWYNYKFETVHAEAIEAYQIMQSGITVFSPLFPSK